MQITTMVEHSFTVQQHGQLSTRQPIQIGNRVLAHKAEKALLDNGAFDLVSAQRIGTVQHDKFDVVFSRSLHCQSHRTDVGKRPTTYILNIVNQYIDSAQHFGSRFPGLSVQRIDR